jgi:hypothetical protein
MTLTKRIPSTVTKLRKIANRFLANTIRAKRVLASARRTGFVRRSTSRIDGSEFVKALVETSMHPAPVPLSGIVDTMESITSDAAMTVQGLRQRLNSAEAVAFLKEQLQEAMLQNKIGSGIVRQQKGNGVLSPFSQVLLEDVTEWTLHSSLYKHYKGSGGPTKNDSAMRLHVIWDYLKGRVYELTDTDRNTPDQHLAEVVLGHLQPGALVIRDLGFYTQKSLEAIQNQGAYFLSRLRSGTHVYFCAAADETSNLSDYLDQHVRTGAPCDTRAYIFKNKFAVRLVAFKASRAQIRRREKDYLKRCKKAGRKPSEQTLRLLRYTVYITNVNDSIWPAHAVELAYRIRWQIELLFKCWKSRLNIHVFNGTNIHRIRCLLYAKLIGLLAIHHTHSILQSYAEDYLDKEVSLPKLVTWLQREGRFSKIIRYGYFKRLWNSLINVLGRLLSKEDNRRRQTTLQKIDDIDIAA